MSTTSASPLLVRSGDAATELAPDTTALQALKALEAIRGQVVAARVNGAQWDLDRSLDDAPDHPDGDDAVEVVAIYGDTDEGRAILRHSTAHLMAQAVTDLFDDVKWAIGPPIENGFYYDFDVAEPFTATDLERIEDRMRELAKERQAYVREEVARDDARTEFADQPYKLEIIDAVAAGEIVSPTDVGDLEGDDAVADPTFTVYRNVRQDGDVAWSDLCRGPHVPSTERIPAFRLLRSAGAYWRGREDRPMLQRIYGTAWESNKAMQAHLEQLEEAAKRDHRKLGRELELTHFPDELGPGLSLFLPRGAIVRQQMEDWIRAEVLARGYQPVYSPHIAKEDLWRISGHLQNYAELMYPAMEIDEAARYRLKPMNCPFHILAYQSRIRSYRELPVRLSELGTVYRYEKSGVVNGQLRARGFTQDDSHIFCTDDQLVDEVTGCTQFALDLYRVFGFGAPSRIAISTRPEKSFGEAQDWDAAQQALIDAVERLGLDYELDEGEGAFYGPKIDIHLRDAIGREWQTTTVQVDFNLPERFDVTYVGEDGEDHRPYMVHRALFGSIERFFAVMVESFNGAFPTWLAPVQATVVPVAADFDDYAGEVADALRAEGARVEVDASDDTLGNKVRKAVTAKVPHVLVVGGNERDARTVSDRPYHGSQRKDVPLDEFVADLVREIDDKVVPDLDAS
ncbi:threonine--tRNA ligase [Salsipaludibacter albus]|uniref:threonine--tRNA ligase n=1 Tax=Salsipaludibacter albus TaxID=2849650 RepID=UPI001EE418B8|nr:threonine--tRNA ligase [Salsipaludibacter albus]MBY5163973.1 threonine--tRNA ligase [Salsipaludibacter albus]